MQWSGVCISPLHCYFLRLIAVHFLTFGKFYGIIYVKYGLICPKAEKGENNMKEKILGYFIKEEPVEPMYDFGGFVSIHYPPEKKLTWLAKSLLLLTAALVIGAVRIYL